jgi:RecA-family ATPase
MQDQQLDYESNQMSDESSLPIFGTSAMGRNTALMSSEIGLPGLKPKRIEGYSQELRLTNFKKAPQEMQDRKQWITWRKGEIDPKTGKPKKHPCVHKGKDYLKNPECWLTFEEALRRMPTEGGIGFVLTVEDPFFCVDLDDCFHGDAGRQTRYKKAFKQFNSWTELSQSLRGVHIWGYGKKPEGVKTNDQKLGIEVYDSNHWIAVTGDNFGPTELRDCQEELTAFCLKYLPEKKFEPRTVAHRTVEGPTLTNEQVLEKLFNEREDSTGKGGKHYRAVYEGDISEYGGDQSSAESALAIKFCFYTQDDAQVQDLLMSASIRDCLEEKAQRQDYWDRTIADARRKQDGQYDPGYYKNNLAKSPGSSPPNAHTKPMGFGPTLGKRKAYRVVTHPICPGFLYRRAVTRFSALARRYKTHIVMTLALAVALGVPFYGKPTLKGKVWYYDPDMDREDTEARLDAICPGWEDLDFFLLPEDHPQYKKISPKAHKEFIKETIIAQGIDVFVFDTMRSALRVLGLDENATKEIGPIMHALNEIARECNCAVVIIHHNNKGGKDSSGSGQMESDAQVDFQIEEIEGLAPKTPRLLRLRNVSSRKGEIRDLFFVKPPPQEESTPPPGELEQYTEQLGKFKVFFNRHSADIEEAEELTLPERIHGMLYNCPEGYTARELAQELTEDKEVVRNALNRMEANKQIRKKSILKDGRRTDVFLSPHAQKRLSPSLPVAATERSDSLYPEPF